MHVYNLKSIPKTHQINKSTLIGNFYVMIYKPINIYTAPSATHAYKMYALHDSVEHIAEQKAATVVALFIEAHHFYFYSKS